MAQGRIPLRYKEKTFTIDCTSPVNYGDVGYGGELDLYPYIENARIAIPLFARKGGFNFPITVAVENRVLRVFSNIAIEGVIAGVLLVF